MTLQIAAADHYEYTANSISVTGVTSLGGSGLTRSFTMPAQNVTVSASFALKNYSINTSGIANGTVTAKNSSGNVITSATCGQTVTLVLAPDAAGYYDYKDGTLSATGVTSFGGSGLTRTFTMPGQNVTVSAEFYAGPTESSTATKAVGDIVLADGSIVRYADRTKMSQAQKDAAVAIIFDAEGKKGVGVKIGEKKKWCSDGAGLYNSNEYTANEEDGAVNKSNAHPHMVVWSEGNYPAFWFAEMENRKGIYNDDNWYLPAEKELNKLFANKDTVNNSFDALGITLKMTDDWAWSSNAFAASLGGNPNNAAFVSSSSGSSGRGKTDELRAYSVRVF